MPSSYPSGLDALQRVAAGDSMQSTSHSGLHNSQSDAIEAIQTVLGLSPQGASATVGARCAALESGKASLSGSVSFGGTVGGTGLSGSLLSSASPVMNGTASAGTAVVPSRQDHVHPTDTSRAPTASPTFTGRVTVASGAANGISQSGTLDLVGTGSPEGAVTAPVGSTWRDTNATTGAIKWIKATGTGNTGWVVEYGDTGQRYLTAVLENGWTAAAFHIRRTGRLVYLTAVNLVGTASSSTTAYTLPVGFRPPNTTQLPAWYDTGVTMSPGVILFTTGEATLGGTRTNYTNGRIASSWITPDAWPTVLPGTAA